MRKSHVRPFASLARLLVGSLLITSSFVAIAPTAQAASCPSKLSGFPNVKSMNIGTSGSFTLRWRDGTADGFGPCWNIQITDSSGNTNCVQALFDWQRTDGNDDGHHYDSRMVINCRNGTTKSIQVREHEAGAQFIGGGPSGYPGLQNFAICMSTGGPYGARTGCTADVGAVSAATDDCTMSKFPCDPDQSNDWRADFMVWTTNTVQCFQDDGGEKTTCP